MSVDSDGNPESLTDSLRGQIYARVRAAAACLNPNDKIPMRVLVYSLTGSHSLFEMTDEQARRIDCVCEAIIEAYKRGKKAGEREAITVPATPLADGVVHVVNGQIVPDALAEQVGGAHYKSFYIQPAEIAARNGLTFLEGCAVKRLHRHSRGGKGVEDLKKAIHEIRLEAKFTYGEDI